MSRFVTTRNLFDENSPYNTNATVLMNGKTYPNGYGNASRTYFMPCKPNTEYTISIKTKGDRFNVYTINKIVDPRVYTQTDRLTINTQLVSYPTDKIPCSVTVRTGNDAKMLIFYSSFQVMATGIQIEEGSTATPYIPHMVEVKRRFITTKNLFDYVRAFNYPGSLYNRYKIFKAVLKPNTDYTASTNNQLSSIGANVFLMHEENETISSSSNGLIDSNGLKKTIRTDETGSVVIALRIADDNVPNNVLTLEKFKNGEAWIQLEEGSVATPYIPHIVEVSRMYHDGHPVFEKEED